MYKTTKDSYTEQVHILTPKDMNGYNRLFGGKIMEWIDILATVVARRHSNKNVTTVCVDNLEFKASANLDDTIVLIGKMVYTGNTSMTVEVKSFVESLTGERTLINSCYATMVAIDDNDKPIKVIPLKPETEDEKKVWEKIKKKNDLRKKSAN